MRGGGGNCLVPTCSLKTASGKARQWLLLFPLPGVDGNSGLCVSWKETQLLSLTPPGTRPESGERPVQRLSAHRKGLHPACARLAGGLCVLVCGAWRKQANLAGLLEAAACPVGFGPGCRERGRSSRQIVRQQPQKLARKILLWVQYEHLPALAFKERLLMVHLVADAFLGPLPMPRGPLPFLFHQGQEGFRTTVGVVCAHVCVLFSEVCKHYKPFVCLCRLPGAQPGATCRLEEQLTQAGAFYCGAKEAQAAVVVCTLPSSSFLAVPVLAAQPCPEHAGICSWARGPDIPSPPSPLPQSYLPAPRN